MKEVWRILINALMAGGLVTLGSMSNGRPDFETIYYALIAGIMIAITQIRESQYFKQKKGKEEIRTFALI